VRWGIRRSRCATAPLLNHDPRTTIPAIPLPLRRRRYCGVRSAAAESVLLENGLERQETSISRFGADRHSGESRNRVAAIPPRRVATFRQTGAGSVSAPAQGSAFDSSQRGTFVRCGVFLVQPGPGRSFSSIQTEVDAIKTVPAGETKVDGPRARGAMPHRRHQDRPRRLAQGHLGRVSPSSPP
jgi:hypothetical protein